jgi:hypothetical protein
MARAVTAKHLLINNDIADAGTGASIAYGNYTIEYC